MKPKLIGWINMPKIKLGMDVLTAAQDRVNFTFDNFERVYISFSGGKDSTAMLHLVMAEAKKRNRKIGCMFLDWECQIGLTVDFTKQMFIDYAEWIEPYWIALPIKTWNACSQIEPEWTAWDELKKELWVRQPDSISITDKSLLPFYYDSMPFEEFVPLFGQWYAQGQSCACFVGIRADESLNRFRTVARHKDKFQDKAWTTNVVENVWNVYPIYDWQTKDIWTYFGKFNLPYNKLYDRMHQAGIKLSQMRICEPFGDEARKGLWLYQVVEPQMWAKVCLRVAGANTGALYSNEKGAVMGNYSIDLPEGHTYESFAHHLLNTMPKKTAEHYKNKLTVYIKWWAKRGYEDGIPDKADRRLESLGKVPTWRKVVKTFLKNDYWCKGLGFSPTKSSAYQKYVDLMKRRRKDWNIFNDFKEAENV
jgi:predicted phosphoadenosine phosphosulfate sulfurtransferase